MEKFKLTVLRNTLIKTISVALIFFWVKTRDDLPIYTLIMAGAILANQIALLPMLKKYVTLKQVSIRDLTKHSLPMILLFVAVIAAHLNRLIDKTMLGRFEFIGDLGCYDYADRIIRLPLGLIAALGTVMLSKMSNMYAIGSDRVRKVLDVSATTVLTACIGFGFGLMAIAPEFIIIYLGEEFIETIYLIKILAFSIPVTVQTHLKKSDEISLRTLCR